MRLDQKVFFVNYALVRSGHRKDTYSFKKYKSLIIGKKQQQYIAVVNNMMSYETFCVKIVCVFKKHKIVNRKSNLYMENTICRLN